MPNIITHYLFAKEVKKNLHVRRIKEAIEAYPHEYIIGSNGPDFLFFYRFFNQSDDAKKIRGYGNRLHHAYINQFYEIALDIYQKEEDEQMKMALLSYLAGHLCHWALDSTTHPYIFYWTGDAQGKNARYHHRFESMLDSIMLMNFRSESIKEFYFPVLARRGEHSVEVIAKVYTRAIKEIFDEELGDEEVATALKDWEGIQKLLYDPSGWKFRLLQRGERSLAVDWLVSGNVVLNHTEDTYDILNEAHRTWNYPTHPQRKSNESFMDLFNKAIGLAIQCICSMGDSQQCCSILDDRSYDAGVNDGSEMVSFHNIYEEDEVHDF